MNTADIVEASAARKGEDVALVNVAHMSLNRIKALGDLLFNCVEGPNELERQTLTSVAHMLEVEAGDIHQLMSQWHDAKRFQAEKDALEYMADNKDGEAIYMHKRGLSWYIEHPNGSVDCLYGDDQARQWYAENGLLEDMWEVQADARAERDSRRLDQ